MTTPAPAPHETSVQKARTAVVVVNFGSHELVEANLAWTQQSSVDGVEVVVVDNFKSVEDARAMAGLAERSGWQLVARPANDGFGAGVNAGAEHALARGAEVVVVVNPDLRLGRVQVDALTAAIAADPDTLVGPLVVDADGRPWGRLGRVDLRTGRLWTIDTGVGPVWISGACLAVHRDLWQRLGGMDAGYFMYWEDVDLCVRAAALGAGIRVLDDVVAVHDVGGTQHAIGGKSALHYYYNTRNRLRFASRLLDTRGQARWLVHTPADVRRVITRGNPPSRWFRLRVALPPALRGAVVGVASLLARRGGAR